MWRLIFLREFESLHYWRFNYISIQRISTIMRMVIGWIANNALFKMPTLNAVNGLSGPGIFTRFVLAEQRTHVGWRPYF